MNTITTKYGTFNVTDNGKNGTIICIGDVKIADLPNTSLYVKIAEFPKVSWWDWDSLEKAIGENIGLIEKRIEERVNRTDVAITKDNALQVLEQLAQVLGNEQKGFYSSRLKQCMNKLKSVA
jgi:hypothetical protein